MFAVFDLTCKYENDLLGCKHSKFAICDTLIVLSVCDVNSTKTQSIPKFEVGGFCNINLPSVNLYYCNVFYCVRKWEICYYF
jgi:hypothetical protein